MESTFMYVLQRVDFSKLRSLDMTDKMLSISFVGDTAWDAMKSDIGLTAESAECCERPIPSVANFEEEKITNPEGKQLSLDEMDNLLVTDPLAFEEAQIQEVKNGN